MRLTRRDWEILERVPTAWWENWLLSLGYVRDSSLEWDALARVYVRRNRCVWIPCDKSLADYRTRLGEMIYEVSADNPGRSILCELAVLFMSSLNPGSVLTALELADDVMRRLDGQGVKR